MDSHPSSHNLAARMARWSSKHRKKAFWGWLAFVILAFAIGQSMGQNLISDVDNFNGESHDAEVALENAGLRPQSETVFIQSDTLTVKNAQFKAAVEDVVSNVAKVAYVQNVKSPLNGESAVSEDGHAALVDFDVAGDSTEGADRIDPGRAAVPAAQKRHPDLDVEQIGDASANKAVNKTIGDDLASAGMLSIPVTLILLVIFFGSLVAASVPLWIGLSSVIAAIGLTNIASQVVPVDSNLPAVILLIGLAVGVDYSLFYLKREREERAAGRSETAALAAAAATSGRAVLLSGMTVLIAMAGMFLSGDKTFMSFSVGAMLVVAVAMLGSLTVLPAILSKLGDRVEKGRIPFVGRLRRSSEKRSMWGAITGKVLRRPVLSAVAAGAVLVTLALPTLQMQTTQTGMEGITTPIVEPFKHLMKAFPGTPDPAAVAIK